MSDNLELFGDRVLTKEEAGIAKELAPGPERLLAALVRRGLPTENLRVAAALVLALDAEARR
jgi:hypothetical protein